MNTVCFISFKFVQKWQQPHLQCQIMTAKNTTDPLQDRFPTADCICSNIRSCHLSIPAHSSSVLHSTDTVKKSEVKSEKGTNFFYSLFMTIKPELCFQIWLTENSRRCPVSTQFSQKKPIVFTFWKSVWQDMMIFC